jgi:hypothetical protein
MPDVGFGGQEEGVVLRRRASLASVESAGRVAVLDLNHLGRPPMVLEGTAFEVWRSLGTGSTLSSLTQDLATRYQTPRAVVLRDVQAFLSRLASMELIMGEDAGCHHSRESS